MAEKDVKNVQSNFKKEIRIEEGTYDVMRWFVGVQVVSLVEMTVHKIDKGLVPTHQLDKPWHIMLIPHFYLANNP